MIGNSKPKMIVVDPDYTWRKVFARLAAKHGFTVRALESFSELKKQWAHTQPDILIANENLLHHQKASNMTHLFGPTPTLITYRNQLANHQKVDETPNVDCIEKNEGLAKICQKAEAML